MMTGNLLLVAMIIRYPILSCYYYFFSHCLALFYVWIGCTFSQLLTMSCWWPALGLEPALSATCFETDRAHSCSQGHCLVTPPERPSCFWRWNCWQMYPLLEHIKRPPVEQCWHGKPGDCFRPFMRASNPVYLVWPYLTAQGTPWTYCYYL